MKGKSLDSKALISKLESSVEEITVADDALSRLKEELIKELMTRLRSREIALVFSAIPLTEEEKRRLYQIFSRLLGRPIKIQNLIDKKLLGGFKVLIGDWKFDGTLSCVLKSLKENVCQI